MSALNIYAKGVKLEADELKVNPAGVQTNGIKSKMSLFETDRQEVERNKNASKMDLISQKMYQEMKE